MKQKLIAALTVVLAGFFAAPAWSQPEAPGVARLTDLVVRTLPVGDIFQVFLDKDPNWPLADKVNRVSTEQFTCLRQRLSKPGFLDQRSAAAAAFAKRYPEAVEPSISVLEGGGAEVFSAAIGAGLTEARSGNKSDYGSVAERFSPLQMSAFVELVGDPKHKALRELIGIDDVLSLGAGKEENAARGRAKGELIAIKLMFAAMDHCKVPLAAIR
ncbi:hypothetical protein [Caenimonas koreensis]|uniref:DUF4142 domain-containing protein n=1 Tax=Caenimonas koreensis DSM 17982 TaxID=1121255 RepID=A0A844BCC1_9BURK|nr:hypothetical protein [Caenimonas koreensis]MRD48151.1 hypothetical protein [Caenimonas koreensis DSM 17982]